jgi:hypothetical protein
MTCATSFSHGGFPRKPRTKPITPLQAETILMPALRNQRRDLFAQGLARGMSAAQAYREAGYVDNRRNASALKTNQDIIARVLEIQAENQERFVLTRQCLIDALIENIEKALGRRPVKIGAEGKEVYVYRGDVANRAIQLAGMELQMFTERKEIQHTKGAFEALSDLELVQLVTREAQALLEDHSGGDGQDQS